MIKAILLDLNGVIEDVTRFLDVRDDLVVTAIGDLRSEHIIRKMAAAIREGYRSIMSHSLPEFHLMFWDDLLTRLHLSDNEKAVFHFYERFIEEYIHVSEVYPDAYEFLRNPPANYIIGILSNGNSVRARKYIWHHSLHATIASFVISHDTPYAKPNKEIFLLAAQRLGVNSSNIVMVGDRIDNDIHGAANADMTPILVDRNCTTSPQEAGCRVIHSLNQLAGVLHNIEHAGGSVYE